jgi:hypothetical protein
VPPPTDGTGPAVGAPARTPFEWASTIRQSALGFAPISIRAARISSVEVASLPCDADVQHRRGKQRGSEYQHDEADGGVATSLASRDGEQDALGCEGCDNRMFGIFWCISLTPSLLGNGGMAKCGPNPARQKMLERSSNLEYQFMRICLPRTLLAAHFACRALCHRQPPTGGQGCRWEFGPGFLSRWAIDVSEAGSGQLGARHR